ncbi:MAG: cation:proton antiporter, partial [Chitinophaga rupis]
MPASVLCLVILLLIFLLKKLRQPYLVAYMLAGILLGPHILGIFSSPEEISGLGEIGILLLMFFLGMEIAIPDKRSLLLQPLIAQGIKTVLCLGCAGLIGVFLHWDPGQMLMMAILLIFNSTAVVSEFLRGTRELETAMGRIVLNILLLQDVLVVPVFAVFQLIGGQVFHIGSFLFSLSLCFMFFLLLRAIRNRNLFQWPAWEILERDHDLQVFTGALICLGFALLASLAGLPAPIGSFAAGVYLGRTDAFHWLGNVL